jgi:hypothetical protein
MRLGDKVELILKLTGIHYLVKWMSKLFEVDCGCDGRKERLNNISRNGKK